MFNFKNIFKRNRLNADGVPIWIIIKAKKLPILESEGNEADGAIVIMNLRDTNWTFGQQIVGSSHGYDWIWHYVGENYWKVVGKWPESPWSCQ